MTGSEALDALVALGGLGGVAATITSLATLVKTRQVHDDTSQVRADSATAAAQLQPDHGSSVADKIDGLVREVRGVGHQVGEIRDSLVQEQEDRRQGDETLRHMIENRPMGYPWEREDSANHR